MTNKFTIAKFLLCKFFISSAWIIAGLVLVLGGISAYAQEGGAVSGSNPSQGVSPGQNTYRAKLESLTQKECSDQPGKNCKYAKALVYLPDNKAEEKDIELNSDKTSYNNLVNYQPGDEVWVSEVHKPDGSTQYFIVQPNRQQPAFLYLALFGIATLIIIGRKGLNAIGALVLSTVIVFGWFIPNLFRDPSNLLFYGFSTILGIIIINQLLGHGWNRNGLLALAGSLSGFAVVVILSLFMNSSFKITGLGGEGINYLTSLTQGDQAILPSTFNFANLFMIGSLIGVAGGLDDVTAAQASIVDEISLGQPKLGFWKLYRQGMNVGGEHIVSMVNTLFLAYLGAALPTTLVFGAFQHISGSNLDLWVLLSRDDFTEEIVRSLLGSFAILLAIPITNALACAFYTWRRGRLSENEIHKLQAQAAEGGHHH